MKVAVIGGASSYTPELVDGLYSRLDSIPVTELWLMDPNAERLEITSDLARRMGARHGDPFEIHHTDDMRAAVEGAKYVVTQIRVGGCQARIEDEKLGLRHGIIGQETTGVGGFANALRTIPPILEVARAMEELAPKSMLINFTNPAGIITEAVLKNSGIRTVGLCNIPIGIVMKVVNITGCKPEDVALDYVGLNHLAWVRKFSVGDEDVTEEVLSTLIEEAHEEWDEPEACEAMCAAMISLGMYCNFYLQYYYATEVMVAYLSGRNKTRGEVVAELERSLFQKYKQTQLKKKPPELAKRGGAHYSTAAFCLIDALENDLQNRQVVCCRNDGAVPTFDDDCAVEVSATIGKDGATALPQSAPEPSIRGLMQNIKAYESLTVEAAVNGNREAAYQALLLHPLTPGATKCGELLKDVLETNRRYLQGTFFEEESTVQ